jgi:hypothetical protein
MPSSRLQPALIGGLFIGVLSALPIISFGNCCCLWVIGGGIVAAYLTQNASPTAITVGDGALAGLMAGVFGAIVNSVLSIPLHLVVGPLQARVAQRVLENARDMPDSLRGLLEPGQMGGAGFVVSVILAFLFFLVICVIFSTIGGMVGAAIFNRNKPAVVSSEPPFPPPPPPLP